MKSNLKIVFGIIMIALLFNSGMVFAAETNPVANIGQGLAGNVINNALAIVTGKHGLRRKAYW